MEVVMLIDKTAAMLRFTAFGLLAPAWQVHRFLMERLSGRLDDLCASGIIEWQTTDDTRLHRESQSWRLTGSLSSTGEWHWQLLSVDINGAATRRDLCPNNPLLTIALATAIVREVEHYLLITGHSDL
jgi:hypothetical protein